MASSQVAKRADAYPSRLAPEPTITERKDGVVRGTEKDGPLTSEQLASFGRDGYLLFEALLSPDEVAEILDVVTRMAGDPARKRMPTTIIEPHSEGVRSLFAVHQEGGVFGALAAHPKIAGAARQVLGSDAYIHQSRVNLKPGYEGAGFPWHSDFETWHVEDGMPRMRAVSFSIALTDNTEFNGPLFIVPGSHKLYVACVGETPDEHYKESLRWQEYGTPDLDSLDVLVERGGGRLVSAKGGVGSAVMFECNTMHGSADNITPFPRSNVCMVYNSVENALVEPFGGTAPRPDYIASRDFTPVG